MDPRLIWYNYLGLLRYLEYRWEDGRANQPNRGTRIPGQFKADTAAAQRDLQKRAREAMGEFLADDSFDSFGSYTFRTDNVPKTARTAWGHFKRWADAVGLARGFIVIEQHKSGVYHLHSLHSSRGKNGQTLSRREMWLLWFERHGMARIEPVNNPASAGAYVAKYMTKTYGPEPMWRYWPDDFYPVDESLRRWPGGLLTAVR